MARFIIVFIFLAGMLFTVFQYIPLLEEEAPHARIELSKKSGDTKTPDMPDDTENEEFDDDNQPEFEPGFHVNPEFIISSVFIKQRHNQPIYNFKLFTLLSPPPKI